MEYCWPVWTLAITESASLACSLVLPVWAEKALGRLAREVEPDLGGEDGGGAGEARWSWEEVVEGEMCVDLVLLQSSSLTTREGVCCHRSLSAT